MWVRRFTPHNRFLCLAKSVEVSHFRGCRTTPTAHPEVDSTQHFPIAVTKVLGSRSFLRYLQNTKCGLWDGPGRKEENHERKSG
jgi:hypothetical protein